MPKTPTSRARSPGLVGAGASSWSPFFFLNLVSVMGRKNVHSNAYCLQCWQIGGSESITTSHLRYNQVNQYPQRWVESHAYLIFRLRQLSQARCVLVRFLESAMLALVGAGGCGAGGACKGTGAIMATGTEGG